MGSKKGKNKEEQQVKVTLIGSMATTVTGSAYRIDFLGKKYLIDLGMYQEKDMVKNYHINNELANTVKKEDIEAVILTHSHLDHCGLIPVISKNKEFIGKIYTSFETSMLLLPLLRDSAHIAEFEAQYIGNGVKPLYSDQDVFETMNKVEACELNQDIYINENVWFKMIQNPHIVGSVQVIMFFKNKSNLIKKVLFTGDIGNLQFKKHYVKEMQYCYTCNAVFMESTYGRNGVTITKKERKEDLILLKNTIEDVVIKNKSRLLIPVFGQDRLQTILTVLYELYYNENFNEKIIIDSKLGMDICNVYKKVLEGKDLDLFTRVMNWENLLFIKDGNESKACAIDKKQKIIISTSGFGSAGRITNHLKSILPNEDDCIIFCGYSSPQSTSGKIRNLETTKLKIGNTFVKKQCKIKQMSSFSSHIQQSDIIKYLKQINTDKVILCHGDALAKNDLRDKAVEELHNIGKSTKIIYGEKNMEIII